MNVCCLLTYIYLIESLIFIFPTPKMWDQKYKGVDIKGREQGISFTE
jgi:hypothetical protein